jgi:hypothetical protein
MRFIFHFGYSYTEVMFFLIVIRVTTVLYGSIHMCALAARILTVDFVVCTLAVKKKIGRFRHVGWDHSCLSLIHDIILRTACLVHYEISPSCKTKFLGTPILRISYGVSWC